MRKKSKFLGVLMVIVMVVAMFPVGVTAAETGQEAAIQSGSDTVTELVPDVSPVVVRGRTVVPVRVIADWLGLPTNYDAKSQSVSVGEMQFYEQKVGFDSSRRSLAYPLEFKLGSMVAKVKAQDTELEVPAFSWKGRTLVPLKFLADAFGVSTTWDPATRKILFSYEGKSASLYVPAQNSVTTRGLEATVKPIIDEYTFIKAAANGPSYAELAKGSSRYIGKPATFAGVVFQAIEKQDGSTVILLQNGLSSDLLAVLYDGPVEVVENDHVTIYGRVRQSYTYFTQAGLKRTVPAVDLVYFSEGMGDVLEGLSFLGY